MRNFLAIILLIMVSCRLRKPNSQQVIGKIVVESNSFKSQTDAASEFHIKCTDMSRPLVFVLRKSDTQTDESVSVNPIQIAMSSQNEAVKCIFTTHNKLCVLKIIPVQDILLKVACRSAPCNVDWTLMQLPVGGDIRLDSLQEIKQNHRGMITVSCSDPEMKDFESQIQLYTEAVYFRKNTHNQVYYFFPQLKTGYYFLTSPSALPCTQIALKQIPKELEFNADQAIEDFLLPQKMNSYELVHISEDDFSLDVELTLLDPSPVKSTLKVSLKLEKPIEYVVDLEPNSNSLSFSTCFKKVSVKSVVLQILSSRAGLINMGITAKQRKSIDVDEVVYYSLKSGEKFQFHFMGNPDEKSKEKLLYVIATDVEVSRVDCPAKEGCDFELTAVSGVQGKMFLSQTKTAIIKEQISINFEKSFTKKVRDEEVVYLSHDLKDNYAIQIVTNTPNVILNIARKEKCPQVSDSCFQKMSNIFHPAFLQGAKADQILIRVKALDHCQFTLTVIESTDSYLVLSDGKPFVYILGQKEQELIFSFKSVEKSSVFFSLSGPTQSLNLLVCNSAKFSDKRAELSTSGSLNFDYNGAKGTDFTVKVQKSQEFLTKEVRFVLIASTKNANLRLEAGSTHVQLIPEAGQFDFIFEIDANAPAQLNLAVDNYYANDVSFQLQLSTADEYKDFEKYIMEQSEDSLQLEQISKKLCKGLQLCELYLRVKNQMKVQMSISITLLVKDSLVQLKDGIWQKFDNKGLSDTTHFFFIPTHVDKAITVLYHSDYIQLKLLSYLWLSDDLHIDPSDWPFPSSPTRTSSLSETHSLLISKEALQKCWPKCVLLLSLFSEHIEGFLSILASLGSFSLVASNNYLQLSLRQRVDLSVKAKESRPILVSLSKVMDDENIMIFCYPSLGSFDLKGNVYSTENPRCPTDDDISDFTFGRLETEIHLDSIKNKLEENDIKPEEAYLCLQPIAYADCKFGLEVQSSKDPVKLLNVDSSTTVALKSSSINLFQVDANSQFTLKISREQGYPSVSTLRCRAEEQFEDCLEKVKKDDSRGVQIMGKMKSFANQPCLNCIYFIRIDAQQQAQVTIHIQSPEAMINLSENEQLTDVVEPKQPAKYQLSSILKEETIVNLYILEGNVKLTVFNGQANVSKSTSLINKVIQIAVPAAEAVPVNPFSFGIYFQQLTVYVESACDCSCSYTISYSSGEQQLYLVDGQIIEYSLCPFKLARFLYRNENEGQSYLHLALNGSSFTKLALKLYSLSDPNNEESRIDITPSRIQSRNNPTVMLSLPAAKMIVLELTLNEKEPHIVSIGVNSKEVSMLPEKHDLPIELEPGKSIAITVNVPAERPYVRIGIRKCSTSQPTLDYTTDYHDFLAGQFQQSMDISSRVSSVVSIHVKESKSLYLQVTSPSDSSSYLVVRVETLASAVRAVKQITRTLQNVSYSLFNSGEVNVSFTLEKKTDSQLIMYASLDKDSLYREMVCSDVAFSTKKNPVKVQMIKNQKGNAYSLSVATNDAMTYLGAVAVGSGDSRVYYKPIEVANIWAVSKSSSIMTVVTVAVAFLVICFVLVLIRRLCAKGKREYRQLGERDY